MLLAIISGYKWVQANWKTVAIAAVISGSFASGWAVRAYIAHAEKNAAIVAENKNRIDKEIKGNEKLSEIEKRNTKLRETTRKVASNLAKNRGVNGERTGCIVSVDGVRGINAIRQSDDPSFNQ
jgi:acyl-coenzyme A synthetase/AMP-(fatty) acid ligase